MRFILALFLFALLLVLLTFNLSAQSNEASDSGAGVPPKPRGPQWQGIASCSAMGCHNANGPKGSKGSEYTTWITHDAHARAYEVLFNDKSKTIVKNLRSALPAHKNTTCLNCHVHPDYDVANHHRRFSKEDGVSCESCHGAAEKWLTEHYKSAWQARSWQQKLAAGMNDTKSITGRVRTCVRCHVGGPGRDVNHDLMAAGHPRLHFEFAAYHATIPHHWPDAKDKNPKLRHDRRIKGSADFEVRAWRIGRLVTAQAALRLLAERINVKKKHPWPEFAEYNCFACHHRLHGKSWRQKRGFGKRKPGSLTWNRWHFAGLSDVSAPPVGRNERETVKSLANLRRLMEKQLVPDRAAVAKEASRAANLLESSIQSSERQRYTGKQIAALFDRFAITGARRGGNSWDEATQYYLALAALHHGWKDVAPKATPPRLSKGLKNLRELLRFPQGQDSPGLKFQPAAIQKLFMQLQMR